MNLNFSVLKILTLISICISFLNAQQKEPEKILIDSSKPAVYFEVVRLGEEEPVYADDSKEKVWLKFINNTKWSVYVSLFVYGKNEEGTGIHFKTERIDEDEKISIARGYRRGHVGSPPSEIKPGKFVVFSVPQNYLAENLRISINYNFEWEYSQEKMNYRFSMPTHSIYFSHDELKTYLEDKGDITGNAINLPKPPFPSFSAKIESRKPQVLVQIEIDENGNVISAKGISGHPVLRAACEVAARNSKFSQTKLNGVPVKAKAVLLYEFNLDDDSKKVEVKSIEAVIDKEPQVIINHRKINNHPVLLVKPEYPKSASYVRVSGSVGVEIVIDENGNVELAEAVSGHPLLRPASVKAALNSKFQPTYLSGKRVKVRDYIIYNFVP